MGSSVCDSAPTEWSILLLRERASLLPLHRNVSFCATRVSRFENVENDFEATISSKLWPNYK